MEGKYTTAIVVRLTGVPAHYLRRLDKEGLLEPGRTPGGQRLYTDKDIETIEEVKRLRNKGVNLAGISLMLKERYK